MAGEITRVPLPSDRDATNTNAPVVKPTMGPPLSPAPLLAWQHKYLLLKDFVQTLRNGHILACREQESNEGHDNAAEELRRTVPAVQYQLS